MEDNNEILSMKFENTTIEHLGISMYARLPPVLGELLANSWDADAKNVSIELFDQDLDNKSIIIKDDGIGMNFEDINNKFLKIGKHRRFKKCR